MYVKPLVPYLSFFKFVLVSLQKKTMQIKA